MRVAPELRASQEAGTSLLQVQGSGFLPTTGMALEETSELLRRMQPAGTGISALGDAE